VGIVDAPSGHLGLCVVALDSPGLFSHIAAAIRLHGYDIVHAEAYTRRTTEGVQEVFDLFRVQPQPHSGRAILTATPSDVAAAISATLLDLIAGRLDPDQALPESIPPPGQMRDTRVRFIEDEEGVLSTLEVETDDRSGLLLTLARALSSLRVTIVRSEVRTRRGRVCDRFVVAEGDGSPISEERRLELQVSVLGAIEAPARRKHA
jgi:UTP:GlnB (protein PII) uridylyltransferase